MQQNKINPKTNLLYGISVALILFAIIFVAILGKIQNKGSESDVRARASTNSGVVVEGVIDSVDPTTGIMMVSSVHFPEQDPSKIKSMGNWTITLPTEYDSGSIYNGARVNLMLNPTTFLITQKTATAIKIEVRR
jgi:hypothetical protein